MQEILFRYLSRSIIKEVKSGSWSEVTQCLFPVTGLHACTLVISHSYENLLLRCLRYFQCKSYQMVLFTRLQLRTCQFGSWNKAYTRKNFHLTLFQSIAQLQIMSSTLIYNNNVELYIWLHTSNLSKMLVGGLRQIEREDEAMVHYVNRIPHNTWTLESLANLPSEEIFLVVKQRIRKPSCCHGSIRSLERFSASSLLNSFSSPFIPTTWVQSSRSTSAAPLEYTLYPPWSSPIIVVIHLRSGVNSNTLINLVSG